ncbi:holin [Streptomyces sp. NPDC058299]|uniref:holin n=1 Tax=Streptomyces sp. NPDC058299 TaxID=3346435 RepID=UPI0036DFFC10
MARRRALTVCSVPGCPALTPAGRCPEHRAEADRQRGSARQRGYDSEHERRFRQPVLQRDLRCVCTAYGHGHVGPCGQPTVHADHWPMSRRELVAAGLDPNDPDHGRGLCGRCHSSETAKHQPGGWNQ